MPAFKTPHPITLTLELFVADVRIVASDRKDTIVEVLPRDRLKEADLKVAELVRVEFADGRLLLKSRKQLAFLTSERSGAIDVRIELPTGSHVNGTAAMADVHADGSLGDFRLKSAAGDISIDRIGGHAEIVTGFGALRIREIDGPATIKNASGRTYIGEVGGELKLTAANGDVSIGRVQASALVKSANGDIRIDEIVRGSIRIETANGELEIGIREGTAAWLDVRTRYGNVRNSLSTDSGKSQPKETVEVRARTSNGDITVRRSTRPGSRK